MVGGTAAVGGAASPPPTSSPADRRASAARCLPSPCRRRRGRRSSRSYAPTPRRELGDHRPNTRRITRTHVEESTGRSSCEPGQDVTWLPWSPSWAEVPGLAKASRRSDLLDYLDLGLPREEWSASRQQGGCCDKLGVRCDRVDPIYYSAWSSRHDGDHVKDGGSGADVFARYRLGARDAHE